MDIQRKYTLMKLTIYIQMDTENKYSNTLMYIISAQKTRKSNININIIMFENLEKVAKRPQGKEYKIRLMYNPSTVNSISNYAKTIR